MPYWSGQQVPRVDTGSPRFSIIVRPIQGTVLLATYTYTGSCTLLQEQDIRRSVVVSIAINHLWSRGAGRRAACARASPASNDPTRTLRAARDARHGRPYGGTSPAKAISPRARALAFWQPGGLQRRWGRARSRPPRRRQRRCCGARAVQG